MRDSIDTSTLREFVDMAIKRGQAFDHADFIEREVLKRLEIGEKEYGPDQFKTAQRVREAREEGIDIINWTFFEWLVRMGRSEDSSEFAEAMELLSVAASCGARAVDALQRYAELARESLSSLEAEPVGS